FENFYIFLRKLYFTHPYSLQPLIKVYKKRPIDETLFYKCPIYRYQFKDIIGFFGFLPDFIFILFLQMGVVFLYKATGVSIAKVASRSFAEPAILLPILTLTIIPSMYLTRTLTERTYDVLTEDY